MIGWTLFCSENSWQHTGNTYFLHRGYMGKVKVLTPSFCIDKKLWHIQSTYFFKKGLFNEEQNCLFLFIAQTACHCPYMVVLSVAGKGTIDILFLNQYIKLITCCKKHGSANKDSFIFYISCFVCFLIK